MSKSHAVWLMTGITIQNIFLSSYPPVTLIVGALGVAFIIILSTVK